MKLVLASFFEPENHGSGRKIGVSVTKPNDTNCDLVFVALAPEANSFWAYHKEKKTNPEEAGSKFVEDYTMRLEAFVAEVMSEAKTQKKDPQEVLPFKDGDTLLSWERKGNLSYRTILAEYLRKLGYEVDES